MCGSDAVPAIMQSASVTNFHESMPPTGSKCGVVSTLKPGDRLGGRLQPELPLEFGDVRARARRS